MAELQSAMSSREFSAWVAYAEIVPMPEDRADLRAATLAALIAEINRDRKRRKRPYTVNEFLDLFSGNVAGAEDRRLEAAGAGPAEDPERKRAELWANIKAWAMRNQNAKR